MNESFDNIKAVIAEIELAEVGTPEALEAFRLRYLAGKGALKTLMEGIRDVPGDQRREYGQWVNQAKQAAEEKFRAQKQLFEEEALAHIERPFDLSAPADLTPIGSRHPVSATLNRIIQIFARMGFAVAEGPEIEDDWHNFTSMNTPEDHPARDMQDTFYMVGAQSMLLRTHTQFHQVEGLYIDRGVSFADMKQTLLYFAQEMFGALRIRLRPSYFPFTEPSAEMDIWLGTDTPENARLTKGTGWLEILGCGMVHPQVLLNCGIDPEEYSGFAFGMGIERQALRLYGIPDIRMLFENDLRFLSQFSAV